MNENIENLFTENKNFCDILSLMNTNIKYLELTSKLLIYDFYVIIYKQLRSKLFIYDRVIIYFMQCFKIYRKFL